MKSSLYVLIGIMFFGIIGLYYGIVLDESQFHQNENKNNLPIHLTSEDFENGIAFTDLNSIEGVSQENVIVVDGILEYDN